MYPTDNDFHNLVNNQQDGLCQSGLQVKALVPLHLVWPWCAFKPGALMSLPPLFCFQCRKHLLLGKEHLPSTQSLGLLCYSFNSFQLCQMKGPLPLPGKASELVCVPSTIGASCQLTGSGLLSVCAAMQNMVFPVKVERLSLLTVFKRSS